MQSAVIQSRVYHSGNFGASAGREMKQGVGIEATFHKGLDEHVARHPLQ